MYFDATSGGAAEKGQLWQYHPADEQLTLLLESPGIEVLDMPDNIAVSPRGGVIMCEDGSRLPQRIHALGTDGRLVTLAANNIVLNKPHNGFQGDFRTQEFAGATFSPDGRWLFVNIQNPGLTLAITGPWETVGV